REYSIELLLQFLRSSNTNHLANRFFDPTTNPQGAQFLELDGRERITRTTEYPLMLLLFWKRFDNLSFDLRASSIGDLFDDAFDAFRRPRFKIFFNVLCA